MLLASKLKQACYFNCVYVRARACIQACWDLACGGIVIPTQRETEEEDSKFKANRLWWHREAEAGRSLLEPRLVYILSSTTARATQKILCLKNKFKVSLGYKVC